MRNIKESIMHPLSLVIFTGLFILAVIFSVVTYLFKDMALQNPTFAFLVNNHLEIMVLTVFVSLGFGFLLSVWNHNEIEKTKKSSKSIIDIVFLFLGQDERAIIQYLIKNEGDALQADIARLQDMGRTRAHRALQKLEEKQIITIVPHGKIRTAVLNKEILELIQE